jgi:hypothetical protein
LQIRHRGSDSHRRLFSPVAAKGCRRFLFLDAASTCALSTSSAGIVADSPIVTGFLAMFCSTSPPNCPQICPTLSAAELRASGRQWEFQAKAAGVWFNFGRIVPYAVKLSFKRRRVRLSCGAENGVDEKQTAIGHHVFKPVPEDPKRIPPCRTMAPRLRPFPLVPIASSSGIDAVFVVRQPSASRLFPVLHGRPESRA